MTGAVTYRTVVVKVVVNVVDEVIDSHKERLAIKRNNGSYVVHANQSIGSIVFLILVYDIVVIVGEQI